MTEVVHVAPVQTTRVCPIHGVQLFGLESRQSVRGGQRVNTWVCTVCGGAGELPRWVWR